VIPEGWAVRTFGETADYKSGRTPARANEGYWSESADGVPWISIADMVPFGTVTRTKERITRVAFDEVFQSTAVRAGTLIMSYKLTIGRVATLGVDACHNEAIIAIYPRPGVDQRYLGYFLAQVDYDALQDRQVKGNTLNRDKIDRIEILLPPLDEQVSIADVLDLVKRSITLQDRTQATLQELKRAAMQALFTRGLRREAQKETEIGPIPESWSLTPVAQLGSVKGGKRMPKGVSLVQENTGRPYIRVSDLGDNSVRPDGVLFVPRGYEAAIRRYRISAADVYISIAGTIGLTGQVPICLDDANLTENAARLVIQPGDVIARYVMYALAGRACQQQIARATAKNAQPKLALTRIEQILVPLPPTAAEQREVVAILDGIAAKIDLHRRKRAVLDELFKTLLHKLMTGEIRVADVDLAMVNEHAQPTPIEAGV